MTERKKTGADKLEQNTQEEVAQTNVVEANTQPITCGLIMPIAANEGGTAEHWRQVREIITSAISSLGFKVQMVSESEAVNVIHKNIVQNIFSNEIVICDVSSRNPNVMFELGMRLAFDKPVVIIKDRDTPFSFDIGSIQHIEYPRTLNYIEILSFQKELLNKTKSTIRESNDAQSKGSKYSPFLINYSITEVTEIKTKEVNKDEYLISAIDELKETIRRLEQKNEYSSAGQFKFSKANSEFKNNNATLNSIMKIIVDEVVTTLNENEDALGSITDVEENCKKYLETNYPHLAYYLKDKIIDDAIAIYMST